MTNDLDAVIARYSAKPKTDDAAAALLTACLSMNDIPLLVSEIRELRGREPAVPTTIGEEVRAIISQLVRVDKDYPSYLDMARENYYATLISCLAARGWTLRPKEQRERVAAPMTREQLVAVIEQAQFDWMDRGCSDHRRSVFIANRFIAAGVKVDD